MQGDGTVLKRLEEFRVIDWFPAELSYEKILETLGCSVGTRIYNKVLALLPELERGLQQTVVPQAWISFGRERWYCLMTLGSAVESYLSLCVKKSLLQGIVADSLAQELFFQIDGTMTEILRRECHRRNTGIIRRLEAPCQLPFEAQKEILEHVERHISSGITLSSSYVFEPPRTMGYILETAPGQSCFHAAHSCSGCGKKDCQRKRIFKE